MAESRNARTNLLCGRSSFHNDVARLTHTLILALNRWIISPGIVLAVNILGRETLEATPVVVPESAVMLKVAAVLIVPQPGVTSKTMSWVSVMVHVSNLEVSWVETALTSNVGGSGSVAGAV